MQRQLHNSASTKHISNSRYMLSGAREQNSISTITNQGDGFDSSAASNNDFDTGQLIDKKDRKNKIESFEDYSLRLRDSLAHYSGIDHQKLFGDSDIPILNSSHPPLPKDQKKAIAQVYHHNKSFNSLLKGANEDTLIQIRVGDNALYENPYSSLKIIKQNHKVFNDINNSFFSRQKNRMDQSIEAIESATFKYKVKMPTVRVCQLISRGVFDGPSSSQDYFLVDKKGANENMKLFGHYKYPNKAFPEGRDQFSLSLFNTDLYLLGGIGSSNKANCIWSLDVESLEWRRIIALNNSSCRFGHSASLFQNKLFVYGGRAKVNHETAFVESEIFNLDSKTWSKPSFQDCDNPLKRRNHMHEMVGQQLLIHGGVGEKEEIFNDTFIFNFPTMKWTQANVRSSHLGPHLYGHSSCLVLPYELKFSTRLHIYKYPEFKKKFYMKERGIYVFGGYEKDEGITNGIYILFMGKTVLEWKKIETSGKKPLPRYFHSTNFYEKGNFIIVHGGRNDVLSSSFAFGDTFILSLRNFDWMEVHIYSNQPDFKVVTRCGHSAVIYSMNINTINSVANKLIIVGGMNNNNYIGSSLFVVNLNFKFQPIKTQQEIQRKKLLSNYSKCLKDRQLMERFKELTSKNQLAIISESPFPPIK